MQIDAYLEEVNVRSLSSNQKRIYVRTSYYTGMFDRRENFFLSGFCVFIAA